MHVALLIAIRQNLRKMLFHKVSYSAIAFSLLSSSVTGLDSKNEGCQNENENCDVATSLLNWQVCDVFLAPTNTTSGWGVFAARDFEIRELVEMVPLYLDMRKHYTKIHQRLHKATALHDYVYGLHFRNTDEHATLMLYGAEMMYNHGGDDSNVHWGMGDGFSLGHYTLRKIKAGEALLGNYGQHDGGKEWFAARNFQMVSHEDPSIRSSAQLSYLKSQHCSKIYSGTGMSLVPQIDESRLAPFEAGLGNARAKVSIKAGERIEQSPGMLLYKPFVDGSALAGLTISWNDLNKEERETAEIFAEQLGLSEQLPIQYQGPDTDWKPIHLPAGPENIVILPFAGRVGMVRRVGDEESSNCRISLAFQKHDGENSGVSVTLEIIATHDIDVGQVLLLNLPAAGNSSERELLKARLEEKGHRFFPQF